MQCHTLLELLLVIAALVLSSATRLDLYPSTMSVNCWYATLLSHTAHLRCTVANPVCTFSLNDHAQYMSSALSILHYFRCRYNVISKPKFIVHC